MFLGLDAVLFVKRFFLLQQGSSSVTILLYLEVFRSHGGTPSSIVRDSSKSTSFWGTVMETHGAYPPSAFLSVAIFSAANWAEVRGHPENEADGKPC